MAVQWLNRVASVDFWSALRNFLGASGRTRATRIADRGALRQFLETRSSYIAQTTLYGYLRTRAGTRFPELFENDAFGVSINIAKWYIWLACLSDLAVFAGGLLWQRSGAAPSDAGRAVTSIVEDILAATGTPEQAGPEFPRLAAEVRARLGGCHWRSVQDDASAFTESPAALVQWAPVIEDFMRLDQEIVSNSVRYAWIEIRRTLRRDLDAGPVMASVGASRESPAADHA